jgi:peptidyl-prolyl cis-trans isomerase SurA
MSIRTAWLTALCLIVPLSIRAETVDRIVAIVGDEIVLLSEIDEEVYLAQVQGRVELSNEEAVAEYRKGVLDAMVEGKLLLAKARSEGIRTTPEEVDDAVAAMVQDVRGRFPSETAFLAQLEREGTSLDQLKRSFRSRVEEQLLVRKVMDRGVRSQVHVEEQDVRDYWEKNRAQIPRMPETLQLRRILVPFGSGGDSDSVAVQRAEIVRRRLQDGEDFVTLASVFSEGPAASKGGDLGWFRLGDLDPKLADAVLDLGEGDTSPVILTAHGAHILKVEQKRDDEFRLRQIVFVRNRDADRAAARARAESLLARVRQGESFEAVADAESIDPAAREGGYLGRVPLESLSPEYRTVLQGLEPGEVTPVMESEEGFSVLRLDAKEGEHDPTYEEVHDRLLAMLQQERAAGYYEEFLEEARQNAYVEIRLDEDEG